MIAPRALGPAATSGPRDGIPGWRRVLARYEPLAWQSMVVGVACPAVLEVLLAIGGVFDPGRTGWVHACAASFVLFGVLAAVTGRVGPWSLRVQCLEAFVMVVVLGTSTTHLGVLAACSVTLVLVLVSAAAYLRAVEVLLLTGAGSAAFTGLMLGQGYGGWPLALTTAAVTVLAGVPAGVLFVFRTRTAAAVAHARGLSRTDALTGLLNRHGLAVAAHELFARARRERTLVGALIVDVDRFKSVNDVYGHTAGDAVLRTVATVVRDSCRPGDVVARFGGEELCVLLLCDDAAALRPAAERLRAAVEAADTRPSVTVSVGGACARPDPAAPAVSGTATGPAADAAEDLVLRLVDLADAAMYEVKRSGRNGVRVHSADELHLGAGQAPPRAVRVAG